MKLPYFVELSPEDGRFLFEFFSKRTFVSVCRERMVEHLVVSDDPFRRGAVFHPEEFVYEFCPVFGLEFLPLAFGKRQEKCRERERNGEGKKEEKIVHAA